VKKALFDGPFGPVFVSRDGWGTGTIAPETEAQLEALRVLVPQDSLPHIRRACAGAIALLVKCFRGVPERARWVAPLSWPLLVDDEFITLMEKNTPETLLVLAHYCALLWEIRNCW
jgi:hypothetical protein